MDTAAGRELRGSVVVGVDGSAHADEALLWAAEQAVLESRPLVVLHAPGTGTAFATAWAGAPGSEYAAMLVELEERAGELTVRAAASVADLVPGVVVRTAVGHGGAGPALLAASRHAALVVVGSRGHGPVRSLLLGSVGAVVSRRARCPVVVLRPVPQGPAGTSRTGVVLADDARLTGPRSIRRAVRHAEVRGLPVTVLDAGRTDGVARSLADAAAASAPDVVVRRRTVSGRLDRALVAASRTAHLVVVAGGRPGHTLGPGGPALVDRARGPVCVVPEC